MDKETIEAKKCCAICNHLYNKEKCPLYNVYNEASSCGTYDFDEKAKYVVFCHEFGLNEKLD